jgi:hypothetical protein
MFVKNAVSQTTWTKYLRWSSIQVLRRFYHQSKQRTAPRVFNSSFIAALFLLSSACNERSTADDMSMPHTCTPDNNERENFDSFLSCLKEVVQSEDIEIDEDECRQRGKPWNSYHKVNSYPMVIISPTTTAQVQPYFSVSTIELYFIWSLFTLNCCSALSLRGPQCKRLNFIVAQGE